MIRNFKNRKSLQILVLVGLFCPCAEEANPALRLWLELNRPLIEKVVGKVGQYIASTAIGASLATHLQRNSEFGFFNFAKNDIQCLSQPNQPTPQAITQGIKKVAQKVAIPESSTKLKILIDKNLTPIPAPLSKISAPRMATAASHVPRLPLQTTQPLPAAFTIAMTSKQPVVKQVITESVKIASLPTFTRLAISKAVHDKINKNSASPTLVKRITSTPIFSSPATSAFKQSIAQTNAATPQSIVQSNAKIKYEVIPGCNPGLVVKKGILEVVAEAQAKQHFIALNKNLIEAIQQKVNVASQQSLTPQVIKEQLLLASHSIPQYHLNAELGVKKGMMLEQFFDRNGEFQGCHSTNTQKQLEEYANGDLRTLSYSGKRTLSWFIDKVKNLWSSQQDLVEQIRTNPYNLNLYNFALQFDAKDYNGAAHFLNLVRPDHPFDNCNKCLIYKNMYNSFITQFFDAKDPVVLADKASFVCKDHSNPVIRTIFDQLFSENTIFKKYVSAYVKNYQDIQIPKEIATQKFTELRTLYLKLATMHPANPQKAQQVRQGLLYIKEACSDKPHANVFNKLAHSIYNQLRSNTDATVLYCRNFAQTFSSPEAQQIQQEILPLISQATELLESVPSHTIDDNLKLSKSCAQELLSHANILYDALGQGDFSKARFIKEHILPTLTPEYVKLHGNPDSLAAMPSASSQPMSLPQQVLATKILSSIPNLPSTSINSSCSAIEDKSKNLQQNSGQCMPEVKMPVPECSMPNQLPPITSCGTPTFKSEAERRIDGEIEATKNKPESGEESRGRQCNWSQGNNLPSFKKEEKKNRDFINA